MVLRSPIVSERKRLSRQHNYRLLGVLEQQGRRIDWFAAQMGVSRWAFWRFETGRSAPPADWYERAAAVLGVKPEDIAPLEAAAA